MRAPIKILSVTGTEAACADQRAFCTNPECETHGRPDPDVEHDAEIEAPEPKRRKAVSATSATVESRLERMANDGELGPIAMRLAIDAGNDWTSLDGDAKDAWHERALEQERARLQAEPKTKRRKGTSPTARTLAELRERGWPAGVVEKFVRFPPPGHHVDLFGVLDIVAIVIGLDTDKAYPFGTEPPTKGCGTIGIQACAGGNGDHSRRRAKILAEPRARQWIEAGNRLELWSWSKRGAAGKAKRWTLRVETYAEMVAASKAGE